jgi:hypothetical protein
VDSEKYQQASNAQPDITGHQYPRGDGDEIESSRRRERSDAFHGLAEKYFSKRAQNDADQNQGNRFQLQPASMRHVFISTIA